MGIPENILSEMEVFLRKREVTRRIYPEGHAKCFPTLWNIDSWLAEFQRWTIEYVRSDHTGAWQVDYILHRWDGDRISIYRKVT